MSRKQCQFLVDHFCKTRGAWLALAITQSVLFLACLTLQMGQPERLVVVLRGDGQCVEGHDQYHQPVESFGLDHVVALPTKDTVPLPPVAAEGGNRAGGGQ